jgi:hypothetical protein
MILGRPFLATSNALINCRNELMKLSFRNMTLEINIFNICKQPGDDNDLQEGDLIEELVYDQFESILSKTKFDESEELQMIYSQEEIKDKKGIDNVVTDHLLKLKIDSTSHQSMITFLMNLYFLLVQWLGLLKISFFLLQDFCQLTGVPKTRKFLNEVKNFFWDDPYLFKYCPNQIFQRCISDNEVSSVIKIYHSEACGGHFS